MKKTKIAFLIHDLGQGGAEKVLVNLVNNMDRERFDITVISLFGGGVNEQFLSGYIKLINCHKRMIPGNSRIMKLFSPKQLYRFYVKYEYDIIASFLEGPSARVVSGCTYRNTKLISWVHCTMQSEKDFTVGFRSKEEAVACYAGFEKICFVSQGVKEAFLKFFSREEVTEVLYNTIESERILSLSREAISCEFNNDEIKLIGVGSVKPVKAFDRLIRIVKRLYEDGFPVHLYILGRGPDEAALMSLASELGISERVTLLGYQTNPYKYVSKSDLFVCSSISEGFSTAATEALIVGTPVCTVEVSGMKEMLGDNNEYGIVTENDDDALYRGISELLTVPGRLEYYKKQAQIRGKQFLTHETVAAVEDMLLKL